MHCIFATITPKPEHYEQAKSAIKSILQDTRSESGCIQFDVHSDLENTRIFLYEQWADEKALQDHYQQAYTKHVFKCYETWLAQPVDIKPLTLLG